MWWFNPWREVSRLRDACDSLNRNWCDTLADCDELCNANERRQKRIEELEDAIEDYDSARFSCGPGSISKTGIPEYRSKVEAREDLFRVLRNKPVDF